VDEHGERATIVDPVRVCYPTDDAAARRFPAREGASLLLLLWIGLTGCQAAVPTIHGEIHDTQIRLTQDRAPAAARVELTNLGAKACELVPVLSSLPARSLPVADGRVQLSLSGADDAAAPMEAYVELNGEPVDRPGGLLTEQGWVTRVDPGDTVLLDVGLERIPDAWERFLICNGPGDYEAGRYAVLGFDR